MNDYKVIFHVDEMDKWKLTLANTRNLITALKDSTLIVEILANSEAVNYLVASSQNDESAKILLDLKSEKINFSACNNSLKALGIDPSSLFPFVTVVPSGVAELTIKQHEGFAYIKP